MQPQMPRTRRWWRSALLAASMVAVLLVPAGLAAAAPSTGELLRKVEQAATEAELRNEELSEVRSEIRAAEQELASVGVALEDARARLVAAEGQVVLAEEALADARVEQARSEAEHELAERRRVEAELELAEQEAVLDQQVVDGFKYGTIGGVRGSAMLELLRRAEDPNRYSVGMRHLQVVVDDQEATVHLVAELREQREELADEAARARAAAVQTALEAAVTLTAVEQLREQATLIADEITRDERRQRELLDNLQVSASELEDTVTRVEARERELRQELAEQRAREEEAARRAAAAAAAAAAPAAGAHGGPPVSGGILCPVPGVVAGRDVINDWGFPRSGGRTHQGNDLFASRGTPVVAVADGVVVRTNPPSRPSRLGGITVTYRSGDGSEWYNAHLLALAEGIGVGSPVSRGQTIGTVGNTGNARTTPPHLHLGRRYGGVWVNPWPTISPVCR